MIRSRFPYRAKQDEGVALLLTLVFIVLLTALVFDFTYEMQVEATLMDKSSSDREALLAAKSAMATALSILNADLEENENEPSSSGDLAIYDTLEEPWAQPADVMHFGDALANVTIIDEYGKFNLNAMFYVDDDGNEQPHPYMELILATILDNSREWYDGAPTEAILDWLDLDDDTREFGAEHDYYEDLDVPYTSKNGPMDSIEELLLIPGITPEIYFGREDFEEVPLFELMTVHGHPEGRININTAPEIVVDAFLTNINNMTKTLDDVMGKRDSGGYTSNADLIGEQLVRAAPGTPANPDSEGGPPSLPEPDWDMFTVYSEVFRIRSDVQHFDTQLRIEAYAYRQTERSRAEPEPQLFRIIDWRIMQ
jgi:general secretion pathway protein K